MLEDHPPSAPLTAGARDSNAQPDHLPLLLQDHMLHKGQSVGTYIRVPHYQLTSHKGNKYDDCESVHMRKERYVLSSASRGNI